MTVGHYIQQKEKTTFALGVDNLDTFFKNVHNTSRTCNKHLKTYMVPSSLLQNKVPLSQITTTVLYLINKHLKTHSLNKPFKIPSGSKRVLQSAVTATNLDIIG